MAIQHKKKQTGWKLLRPGWVCTYRLKASGINFFVKSLQAVTLLATYGSPSGGRLMVYCQHNCFGDKRWTTLKA